MTALHARVPLTLHEPSPTVLSSALKRLDGLLSRDVEKGRISKDEADAARGRVRGVEGDAAKGQGLETDVDLVIEVSHPFWRVGQKMVLIRNTGHPRDPGFEDGTVQASGGGAAPQRYTREQYQLHLAHEARSRGGVRKRRGREGERGESGGVSPHAAARVLPKWRKGVRD